MPRAVLLYGGLFIQALCAGCHVAPEVPSLVKLFVKHWKRSADSCHNTVTVLLCCDALVDADGWASSILLVPLRT